MKIIRLQSSNVMRLVAVDITPKGDLVVVGGRNGAGKSSVLNSIAMALGGLALAPEEPIRAGESEAKIVVDLDGLRVTRRFSRERVITCEERHDHGPACSFDWSETRSTLSVTSLDGLASYRSPQAMLDKLLGKLTFDPLAFKDDKNQAETLRRLVGLDTTAIDDKRRAAFVERARLKKEYDAKAAVAAAMPQFDGVPTAEIPMKEISDEMLHAEELRRAAEEAERRNEQIKHRIDVYGIEERALALSIRKIEEQLEAERAKLKALQDGRAAAEAARTEVGRAAVAARAAVPDAGAIRARLAEAEAANARVRANAAKAAAQAAAERTKHDIDVQHEIVIKSDEQKRAMIAAAKFPVEGLGLSDDGVTFGGLPFSQASSSEQLRVSVAIGLALNPTLRVLLIRSGNTLDEDSLAAVAAQAEAADAQVWIEWVTKNPEGVSVMIEEGRVAQEVTK